MHTYSRNPIRLRLLRGGFRPGEAAARWIGVGVGAAVALAAGLLTQQLGKPDDWSIRLGAEPLLLVIGLVATFVLAAGLMAGAIQGGDYALIRLSSLRAEAIVEGYTEGFRYRLRLLRAVTVWSPAGWAGCLLLSLPLRMSLIATCGMIVMVTPVGVLVAQAAIRSLSSLMVSAGVWLALRLGRHAGVLAAGIGALVGSALIISLLALFSPGLFRCCAPMLGAAGLVALDSRRGFFHKDAIRAVETKGWPVDHPQGTP